MSNFEQSPTNLQAWRATEVGIVRNSYPSSPELWLDWVEAGGGRGH
uniref:Uncharacterized protein n=1 Tax=Arundo donax TaxID=35708 RepID=A0A0A9GTP1_ARUDO